MNDILDPTKYSVFLLAFAGLATMARADIILPAGPSPIAGQPSAVDVSITSDDRLRTLDQAALSGQSLYHADGSHWALGPLLAAPPMDPSPANRPQEGAPAVHQLPAVPSSADLFLSAMLSVGGWRCARSARDFHIANLPEWYHPGAPYQIGHTLTGDLQIGTLPVCPFQQSQVVPPWAFCIAVEDRTPKSCHRCLTTAAPRGPPE